MCQDILERHGEAGSVDFSMTGDDAFKNIKQNSYNIILLSYELDHFNGIRLLEQLSALRPEIPIVMMINEANEAVANEAIAHGAYDYIIKVKGHLSALPFTIRKVIERKRINSDTPLPKSNNNHKSTEVKENAGAMFVLDKRGRFISANKKLEAIAGYTEFELLELTLLDLFSQMFEISFYQWFKGLDFDEKIKPFNGEIVTKSGDNIGVEISLTQLSDDYENIIGFQGHMKRRDDDPHEIFPFHERIDQLQMVQEIVETVHEVANEPIQLLLQRLTEIASHVFKFRKVTLALLDRRRHVFVKQVMIGFSEEKIADERHREVPQKVITKVFSDDRKLKVIYSNEDGVFDYDENGFKEHLLQEEDGPRETPHFRWQKKDLILVNLIDKSGRTFGYFSLSQPINENFPMRDTLNNLELFGKLASLAVESQHRLYMLNKKNRRLKQILVTSNIFKLHLNLSELLNEVVWSVKLLLDYNLVGLALVSSRSGMLEMRAVACDDKIKVIQLKDLRFSIPDFARLLKSRYKRSKSYLLEEDGGILSHFKSIYYGARNHHSNNGFWKKSTTLLVPIPSRDQRIAGVLIVDDPTDNSIPDKETLRTLELLANQVGITIDNRIMYIEMKNRLKKLERMVGAKDDAKPATPGAELRNLVDQYFG